MPASLSFSNYQLLKKAARADLKNPAVASLVADVARDSLAFLRDEGKLVELISQVPGKSYFAYQCGSRLSRPLNANLFNADPRDVEKYAAHLEKGDMASLPPAEVTRAFYTLAAAFPAATDIFKTGDKKSTGTFFEILIAHAVARQFGLNPARTVQVVNLDMKTTLPTDYVFDFGPGLRKFHLPIKLSTRERVIQVWGHQRVLDGVFGVGRFAGVLVALTETKLDSKKRTVVEICLPDQWRLYQMFLAQMRRVYYLDTPVGYLTLVDRYPSIPVKEFGAFFAESATL